MEEQKAMGTYACPICGKDTPHYHSPEEVKHHQETEAWAQKSWEQFRDKTFGSAS